MLSYIVESFKKGVRHCRAAVLAVVDVWVDIKEGLITHRDVAFLAAYLVIILIIILLAMTGIML
jgi:hypothetical protein|tara:strand:+ start:284 stop:475 length:192 start_codon:yes stop_codon:yes gene_type:complete